MTKTEQNIKEIIEPTVLNLGYILYDVMYLKESSEWFLRVFIDKENGNIDLDDCEKVSNAISDVLDEKDPIVESYNLEVSSCGVERHLREPEHFKKAVGKSITVKTFKAINGLKEFEGVLSGISNDKLEITAGESKVELLLSDISSCKLSYSWEDLKNE